MRAIVVREKMARRSPFWSFNTSIKSKRKPADAVTQVRSAWLSPPESLSGISTPPPLRLLAAGNCFGDATAAKARAALCQFSRRNQLLKAAERDRIRPIFHAPNPFSRPAIRSSKCSRPIESRSTASLMPATCRASTPSRHASSSPGARSGFRRLPAILRA